MKKHLGALVLAMMLTSCYGSFSAWDSVHRWNGHATGSKVGNSVIHGLFWIIPVYPLIVLGDLLIFNTVEFITDERVFK